MDSTGDGRKGEVLEEDNKLRREEVPAQADRTPEVHSFDDLAMELADGTLTRARVLKLMGAAILGGLLGGGVLGMPEVEARRRFFFRRRHRRRRPPPTVACAAACTFGCCVGNI